MQVRNAIFSSSASGILQSLLQKIVCELNTGPHFTSMCHWQQQYLITTPDTCRPESSLSPSQEQTGEPGHPYLLSKMCTVKNVTRFVTCKWLKCFILTSADEFRASEFLSICTLFFSIGMWGVLLQKKFISWTVVFYSTVVISVLDKSTLWPGAYLQICQRTSLCGNGVIVSNSVFNVPLTNFYNHPVIYNL